MEDPRDGPQDSLGTKLYHRPETSSPGPSGPGKTARRQAIHAAHELAVGAEIIAAQHPGERLPDEEARDPQLLIRWQWGSTAPPDVTRAGHGGHDSFI